MVTKAARETCPLASAGLRASVARQTILRGDFPWAGPDWETPGGLRSSRAPACALFISPAAGPPRYSSAPGHGLPSRQFRYLPVFSGNYTGHSGPLESHRLAQPEWSFHLSTCPPSPSIELNQDRVRIFDACVNSAEHVRVKL